MKIRFIICVIAILFLILVVPMGLPVIAMNNPDSFTDKSSTKVGVISELLHDDFEDGDSEGWIVQSGTWTIYNDSGNYVYNGTATDDEQAAYAPSTASCIDFIFEAKVKAEYVDNASHYGIIFRGDGTGKYYGFYLNANPANEGNYYFGYWNGVYNQIVGWTSSSGAYTDAHVWNSLKVEANGTNIKLYINDILVNTVNDSTLESGYIGLIVDRYLTNAGQSCYFDDIYVATVTTDGTGPESGLEVGGEIYQSSKVGLLIPLIAPTVIMIMISTILIWRRKTLS